MVEPGVNRFSAAGFFGSPGTKECKLPLIGALQLASTPFSPGGGCSFVPILALTACRKPLVCRGSCLTANLRSRSCGRAASATCPEKRFDSLLHMVARQRKL